MPRSVFADLHVANSYRTKFTPRVARPYRPKVIAWAGPAAFYQSRFCERNQWYKARIKYPDFVPELYIIEPTDYYRTLAERLEDDKKTFEIDIGFAKRVVKPITSDLSEEELEKRARRNQLFINIDFPDNVNLEIIQHFNVFKDLFGDGTYFNNVQEVKIDYGEQNLVKFGNPVNCALSVRQPSVSIESGKEGFTTMLMLNLEGGITEQSTEESVIGFPQIIHWLVANIEDSKAFDSGNTVVPYLQPTPFYGTGYHRIAFLFFRHNERINVENFFKLETDSLFDRIFHTRKFAKQFENSITPSAIRFCQMDWDVSVDDTLAKLGMKSPRFWYDWNEPRKPEQVEFPAKAMPFDLYLDMYRNPKEVERTVAREWLEKRVHEGGVKKSKYPDIFYAENKKSMPPWLHQRHIDKNTGTGIYARLYSDFKNPAFQARSQ